MDKSINIILVSLNDKFCKSVGIQLSDTLEMFSANCEELIIYDLINPKEVLQKCGIEYLRKREKAVVKNCSEYENTVITVSYDLFKSYSDLFNRSLKVYIKLPQGKQDKVPNSLDYVVRDELLTKNSDITVELEQKSNKKCIDLLLKKLGDYYENCWKNIKLC